MGIPLRARRTRARSPSHEKVSRERSEWGPLGVLWRLRGIIPTVPQDGPEPSGQCPSCGKPCTQTIRYPQALCGACVQSATDLGGRPVRFSNVSLSGGFIAHHRDDDSMCAQVTNDGRVLIAGIECAAGEARFGGTVVQPRRATETPLGSEGAR